MLWVENVRCRRVVDYYRLFQITPNLGQVLILVSILGLYLSWIAQTFT